MRKKFPDFVEQGRIKVGQWASPAGESYGAFSLYGPCGRTLAVIVSDADGWEHVSVSTAKHVPNWREMSWIKSVFWASDECVMQLHPPEAEYINNCGTCLHLWKPLGVEIPRPPGWMVGVKQWGLLDDKIA
jgi:hypothetical protein